MSEPEMADQVMNHLVLAGSLLEIGLFCVAGFVLFRIWRNTFAEAAAYAIITTLMGLTCLVRITLITGIPAVSITLEGLSSIGAIIFLYYGRSEIQKTWLNIRRIAQNHPLTSAALFLIGSYLTAQVIILPPTHSHWRHLVTVLWFLQNPALWQVNLIQAGSSFDVNHSLLAYLFLRCQSDAGIGIFGLMAYSAIGFSTYALARRYAWPPTAFTVTLVVISLPRIVFHAVSPGYEIIPAAASILSILAVYRVVEKPNFRDLMVLIFSIIFISTDRMASYFFLCIMICLSCLLLFRRHGIVTWKALFLGHRRASLLSIIPIFLLSPGWRYLHKAVHSGNTPWVDFSIISATAQNKEALSGTLANMIRYVFESAHFTKPIHFFSQWAMGFSPQKLCQSLYALLVDPVFGAKGSAVPFEISWIADETLSWFGPFGFLLIMPAILYALIKGPRRLKAITIALCGYYYMICLVLAWIPGNARHLTIFYVCGGFCIAFLIPPWRLGRTGKGVLKICSALLLIYAVMGNSQRPAMGSLFIPRIIEKAGSHKVQNNMDLLKRAATESIWVKTDWGRDRQAVSKDVFGDNRVHESLTLIPIGTTVGIISKHPALSYPYLKHRPDLNFIPVSKRPGAMQKEGKRIPIDYLLTIDASLPAILKNDDFRLLWSPEPDGMFSNSKLVKVYRMRNEPVETSTID